MPQHPTTRACPPVSRRGIGIAIFTVVVWIVMAFSLGKSVATQHYAPLAELEANRAAAWEDIANSKDCDLHGGNYTDGKCSSSYLGPAGVEIESWWALCVTRQVPTPYDPDGPLRYYRCDADSDPRANVADGKYLPHGHGIAFRHPAAVQQPTFSFSWNPAANVNFSIMNSRDEGCIVTMGHPLRVRLIGDWTEEKCWAEALNAITEQDRNRPHTDDWYDRAVGRCAHRAKEAMRKRLWQV